jgi:branched-chain amino acid transport system substrate-binding protein
MSGGFLSRRDVVVGGTLAATTLVGSRRAWSQAGPIRIGVLQTISGPLATVGNGHVVGAKIAAKMLNDGGGIDGRQVELVIRDTKAHGDDMVAGMRDLTGSGINLLVGEAFSTPALAAIPLAPSLDAIYCSPTMIAMELTHDLFNRNCFRVTQSAYMQFLGQAKLIADHYPNLKTWGCFAADAAGFHFAQTYLYYGLKKFYAANGKQITLNDPVLAKVGANDYRDQSANLLGQKLDGLVMADAGGEALTFLKQANAFGLFKTIGAVTDMTYSPALGPALKKDIPENWWTTCTWVHDHFTSPMAQAFYKEAVAATNLTFTDPYNAQCHTAVMALASGVKNAKSTKTDDVIKAMEAMTFETVYGPLDFRKEDHQAHFNVGFVRLGPDESEAGWKVKEFVQIPWQVAMEPPTPGKPFVLPPV